MVFESLVVDLINKYLGDYVENLDRSQLKLGIWGGDAVLQNLDLKESALDDLDLPVQIKAGHIGKLTLKIPWKNLYTEPVVASIDGVYALAVPKIAIEYNEEKEEKAKQEAKQKKLLQIEEAKKLQAEKEKPKEPKKDSFAEKMATQIIKNLQIHIKNIHVRYEDRYTNPKHPFSIGATLGELLFQTTDEHWRPCILKEAVTQIYKLIKLNNLSLYWNSSSVMYSEMDKAEMLKTLKADVETDSKKPRFDYLVRPISSVAHLRLHTKPEQSNYSQPKVFLTTIFDEIAFALAKSQYDDVLGMLESFERMYLLNMYKKYRPTVPLQKHAKAWWHYAMNSILEETVRRRRRMFSWTHIIGYRRTMKKYRTAYTKKLQTKKVPSDLQKELDEYEKVLDVFCITLMRQQAEVEAARQGAKKAEEKSGGWFGGWFGGKKKKEEKDESNIEDKFKELYTDDEKSKLYDAIGYHENETDPNLPKEFVALRLVTKLNNLSVTLNNKSKTDPQILNLQLKDVYSSVGQRPAANAVQVEAKIDEFTINGSPQDKYIPKMVQSQNKMAEQTYSLADFNFETNPLDGKCDTRIKFNARPLQIVYDAVTVNQLAEFFKPPEEVYLKQLSQAAMAKFDEIKEQSATGLQHAMEQRKYTDIMVDLQPSYVIVPSGGKYQKDSANILLLDLGSLKINSEKNQSSSIKEKADAVDDILQRAYDNFNIKLDRIQMLFAKPGEDWQSARKTTMSPMHILNPISIKVVLQKCMFENDARMPKMKISGELPLLSLSMSDKKLEDLLKLATSIPLPESAPAEVEDEAVVDVGVIPLDVNENQVVQAVTKVTEEEMAGNKTPDSPTQEFINYTDLQLKFEIGEVSLHLHEHTTTKEVALMKVVIKSLGTEVAIRKYDMNVEAYLGGIYLQHLKFKAPPGLEKPHEQEESNGPLINLVNTPVVDDTLCRLLTVTYLKANPEGPEFVTKYGNTEQKIDVRFTALEVLLHLEAIQSLMKFADDLQNAIQSGNESELVYAGRMLNVVNYKPANPQTPWPGGDPPDKPAILPSSDKGNQKEEKKDDKKDEKGSKKSGKKKKSKEVDPDKIDIEVNAQVDQISVGVCTEQKLITDMRIKGINAGITIQEAKTSVAAMLKAITVLDPDEKTLYPRIMEIEGDAVLKLALVIYNNATEGDHYSDMSAVDTSVDVKLGCIRLVFLNKFVTDLLDFLDNFQTAKDKIKEASDAVAESAMDVVAKLQEKSPRVLIKVHMSAPVIVIPRSSRSLDLLMADFGELDIGNSFSMPGKLSSSGVPAVLDGMNISLTKLKVLRAKRDDAGKIIGQSLILEPVNISLSIVRNLSISWYMDQPEVDISGMLHAVSAVLSQGDFTVLMYVLNENLTEGQPAPSYQAPAAIEREAQVETTSELAKPVTEAKDAPVVTVTPPSDKSAPTDAFTKLKFKFEIESLQAQLFTGDSTLTEDGTNSRKAESAIGKFELQVIAVEGKMMSDTRMKVKVILQDTVLDDTRVPKQKGGITRMIERFSSSGAKQDMIDVDFEQDISQDKNIQVRVSSIHMCVCLDFLMSLADFFTKGMPQTTPPQQQQVTEVKQEVKAKSTTKDTAPPGQGEINITVTVDKPEIILIEDQMNPKCNALVLETELSFRMRMTPETQDMSANIRDLQIVSRLFNEPNTTGAQILNPCQISFYSKAPQGKGAHMDISATDLILNISPGTIHTLTLISAGLSQQQEEEEKKKREQIPSDLWLVKKVSDMNFWFTKTTEQPENKELALPVLDDIDVEGDDRGEQNETEVYRLHLILKVPIIVVKIEGAVGKRTVPLLIAEAGFQGEVRDWSGKLEVESSLLLEVAFYNEKLSVWEPLIEPVLQNNKFRRWELALEVTKNDDLPPLDDEEEEADTKNINLPPPKMSINVKSHDTLQLTVTKTCIEALTNLGKAFGDAYRLVKPSEKAGEVMAPYILENHTGLNMVMKLDNTFEMPEDAKNGKVTMHPDRVLPLFKKKHPVLTRKASVIKAAQEGEEEKFIFQIEQYNATREITIKRAEERLYMINHKTYPGDEWSVVCTTETPIGQRVISLRSIVQMKSHLLDAVEVFYKGDKDIMSCGIVQPGHSLNVPLHAVYTPGGEFYFQPVNTVYGKSKEAVVWRAAENMGIKQISCEGPRGVVPYYIGVRGQVKNVYFDETEMMSAKTYILHLSPTVVLHNLLPFPITVLLEGMAEQITLNKGQNQPLNNACFGKSTIELAVPEYKYKEWTARCQLRSDLPEMSMLTFQAYEGAQTLSMNLGLHCKQNDGCREISVYSPYWMINKTGKTIFYKTSDSDEVMEHPYDCDSTVLFSFRQKTFLGAKKKRTHTLQNALAEPVYLSEALLNTENIDEYRKCQRKKEEKDKKGKDANKKKIQEWKQSGKALLRIGQADWSDKFSLDTVGSSGTVQCKAKSRVYEVGVKIRLSNSGLTKICTFTPFFMLLNTAEMSILCTETTQEDWVEVQPGKCLPFWPVQSGKEISMKSKFKGSNSETMPFLINKSHTTLMKLNDQYGGINAECQITESAMVTTFCQYQRGMASVLMVNNTDRTTVKFIQSGEKTESTLGPNEVMLYTWENALGKREIAWTCGEVKGKKNDLLRDGSGGFFVDSDTKVYWVSFLDGMQRVLLFTDDPAIAINAQEAGELEQLEQEINVCIQGMGVSLVNDDKQVEVAYLGITSSGIIWEEKKKRYKALSIKNGLLLEEAYQKFQLELDKGHTPPEKITLANKMEINFAEMKMMKPNKRTIRRSFQDGIWLQYKTSAHQLQLHAKINRLQLDNMTRGPVFPTVLAPIPPPKSVAAESVPKPFTEVSIMLTRHEHSKMVQFKYFKVLIQEMSVKVDQGFLNNVIDLFTSNLETSREQETEQLIEDVKQVQVSLMEDVGLSLAEEQKNFYDYLHFSPIKIHLSFSLQGGGGGDGKPTQIHANVINIFLQSVGVVLTDVQDVVFKLGFFQREHCFYNQTQISSEMTRHYAGQAIKQAYVLVLGLDVLGNPFGLLRGMAEGVEDLFYEPYQGAIQGPEEFAEGLALGVRSLLGHAVGGAAGAVSRITGTIGKGIAALTLDDEYQKKRREALNKRPANVREGFARGGKGLVMGVFDGVTGIVRKPIEGAQKEGVEGFFKGIGKGLVGVVTRPTSGVIDFASSSFEGIKRIADMSSEVGRLRSPRRFHPDRIIRPYNGQEADGYAILQETEKGKFIETDDYVAHAVVSRDGKHVLLVTDKRVIFANRGEIFGHWDADWTYMWQELKEAPKVSTKGIEFILKEKEKKKLFSIGSSLAKKEIPLHDKKLAEWIVSKMKEAYMHFK